MTRATTDSSTGSVMRRRTKTTAEPSTAPVSAPPPASTTNCATPCHSTEPQPAAAELPTAKDTAIWNSTRLVASLNRLSACTSAWIRGGSDSRRPSALTATGSVLARTAPSTNAIATGTAVTADSTAATAAGRRQHQAHGQDGDRPPDRPQIPPRQITRRGPQQRRQHHEANHLRRHPHRGDPRYQADHHPGQHQQGRRRDPQPAGEGRPDRAQRHQGQDYLRTVHAIKPVR